MASVRMEGSLNLFRCRTTNDSHISFNVWIPEGSD